MEEQVAIVPIHDLGVTSPARGKQAIPPKATSAPGAVAAAVARHVRPDQRWSDMLALLADPKASTDITMINGGCRLHGRGQVHTLNSGHYTDVLTGTGIDVRLFRQRCIQASRDQAGSVSADQDHVRLAVEGTTAIVLFPLKRVSAEGHSRSPRAQAACPGRTTNLGDADVQDLMKDWLRLGERLDYAELLQASGMIRTNPAQRRQDPNAIGADPSLVAPFLEIIAEHVMPLRILAGNRVAVQQLDTDFHHVAQRGTQLHLVGSDGRLELDIQAIDKVRLVRPNRRGTPQRQVVLFNEQGGVVAYLGPSYNSDPRHLEIWATLTRLLAE